MKPLTYGYDHAVVALPILLQLRDAPDGMPPQQIDFHSRLRGERLMGQRSLMHLIEVGLVEADEDQRGAITRTTLTQTGRDWLKEHLRD